MAERYAAQSAGTRQLLSAAKGLSVIGPRDTFIDFAKKIGAKYLNIKGQWSWEKNRRFLLEVVKRGDDVVFAGKYNPKLLDPNSILAKEIRYLTERGYSWTKDFSKLVKN